MKSFMRDIYHALVPFDMRVTIRGWLFGYKHVDSPYNASMRVSFIGPWNYQLGLGVASKGYLSALLKTNYRINAFGITRPFHTHTKSTQLYAMYSFEGPSDVCLINIHPDMWPLCFTRQYKNVIKKSKVRIGIWFWETSELPSHWKSAFSRLDALWAPSAYCAEIFAKATGLPVEVVPCVVPLPDLTHVASSQIALRKRLNLAQDAKIILYVFDGMSSLLRKNPLALVRSFRASGLAQKGWVLVMKVKNLFDNAAEGNHFMSESANDTSIIVLNVSVSRYELTDLFLGCDIYASSHSAEGFGLTIAEAMAAEKLVVATDFSASSEFLDNDTGYPVAYRTSSVEKAVPQYSETGEWALVDEDDLRAKLCEAATDFEAGNVERGVRARQRVAERFSEEAIASRIVQVMQSYKHLLDAR